MNLSQRHAEFLVPAPECRYRLQTFQAALETAGIAVAWIDYPSDRYYFSGSLQDGVLLIPAQGEPDYFVKKSLERARVESPLSPQSYPGKKALLARVGELAKKMGSSIGLAMEITPASTYHMLLQSLSGFTIRDIGAIVRNQKAVKSDWEIEQVREATDQALSIFEHMADYLRPGITELEFTGAIEGKLRAIGHGGPLRIRRIGMELAMITAVSGDSACYPTNFDGPVGGEGPYPSTAAGAGWRLIQNGDTVMADLVTSYNGYHADNARTWFLGESPPDRAVRAHAFCLECLDRLESAIRPGRTCAEVFVEVDQWAKKTGEPEGFMGFGENRVKFFGHGVGLELDEMPVIADRIKLVLSPGMVLAVEPKAFLPGIGPVGVENTYHVTENGCESFCKFPRELMILK